MNNSNSSPQFPFSQSSEIQLSVFPSQTHLTKTEHICHSAHILVSVGTLSAEGAAGGGKEGPLAAARSLGSALRRLWFCWGSCTVCFLGVL